MLYVLHGTDTQAAREKLADMLADWKSRQPDLSEVRLTDEQFSVDELNHLIESRGLFTARTVTVLDAVCTNSEFHAAVLERIPDMTASDNVFVVLEPVPDKKLLDTLAKHAHTVRAFKGKKEVQSFDRFALTDALGMRDKKHLWVLLQRAFMDNAAPEELHGMLFWQVKSILLASQTNSAKEAGMKTLPFNKAKKYVRNYSQEELQALLKRLVTLYHQSRRGDHELSVALEQFALTL